MTTGLDGRVALVTGGSRGIGLGIADALLAAGAHVCITGRTQADLDQVVADREPEGTHERIMAVAGRTDDGLHRRAAVEAVLSRWGRLDLLVNNAATNPQHGPLMDADLEAVRKVLAVNLVAPLGWVQAAWHAWMAEHGGAVLNIASIGGIRAGADIGAYNASKAALIHLTRQLALELAPGVRVNAIAPAVVKTRFAEALYLDREDEVAAGYPLQRLGTPQDTAGIARFLLSDEAAWITGETVVVDGGVSLVGRA